MLKCAMRLVLGLGVIATVACGSDKRAAPAPAVARDAALVTPPIDAVPVPIDAARPVSSDEAARRVGHDDGVASGAAAVATEGLVEALAIGAASLSTVVVPTRGVYEAVGGKVERRCGGAARDVAATYVGRMIDQERGGAAQLVCDNAALDADPVGPTAPLGRHALCRTVALVPEQPRDVIVLAPVDGALRVVAVATLAAGAAEPWPALGAALTRKTAPCP